MKKDARKKLTLCRESVRRLEPGRLQDAVGGAPTTLTKPQTCINPCVETVGTCAAHC